MSAASDGTRDTDTSDETLAAQCAGGDLTAFDALARRYQDRLYSYALRLCGDTYRAADLAQETLLRAFRSLERFDPTRRFGPWVFGIASHVCRDWLRWRGRQREQSWETLDAAPGPDATVDTVVAGEERERVHRAVERLPLKYREVIVLHYLEELPYDAVAESLGIKPEAARRRALRARQMLRRYLGGSRDG